ncbi:neuronal acetylcholine receptor subunit beta-4-like [Dreissena polymorpha]|uniref:Uncharacterized protein n=1 Tax=Dreissena polymorpha TaxID=45954 RepID=A0A9D4EY58_DREPO|nr:neuronal acetylcholine receptor subunit beta-4-like [Dreissena polymorpha]KAH3787844.1 hypothetical protein DPMN_165974 [Dreissena polymorpha]
MHVKINIAVVIITCMHLAKQSIAGVTADNMTLHLEKTFLNYDTRVRPLVDDQSDAVDVEVDFHLLDFMLGVEKLETTAFLEISWTDQILAKQWHNAGVPELMIPQSDIWLPDLALQNGFKTLSGLGNSFYNVKVNKEGKVTWRPYHVFNSACTIDVTYFPFDKTTCDLKFIVWSNPKSLLKAHIKTGIIMDGFSPNSEWEVVSTTAVNVETDTSTGVTFSIFMKRKPLFYLVNILIPVIMLAALNPFVFALPASSGEKTGFAVTAFLAFAVFLTVISAELPTTSDDISTFSAYLFITTFLSALISMVTITELRLFVRKDDVPIPLGIAKFTKTIRGMKLRTCCSKYGGYIRGLTIEEIKRRLDCDVTWSDVVDAIDFVLFWVFLFLIAAVTTACYYIAVKSAL